MARHLSLADAVAELVHDGDTVALEGFTHLIPFAAGHEIIRQGRRDLTLVRMTPDVVYDQLIGAGLRPQAGLLLGRQPRRRLAAPLPRRGRARLAGAAGDRGAQPRRDGQPLRRRRRGLPFAVLRGYGGTDLDRAHRHVAPIDLPVHRRGAGRRAGAATPTSRSSTPSRPTAPATCSCGASPACRRRPCWPPAARSSPSRRSSTSSSRAAGAVVLPGWAVTAVAEVPGGAHPSYAAGYSDRDNDFYRAWDAISRDRDAFQQWLRDTVHAQEVPHERAERDLDRRRDDDRRGRPRACTACASCFVGIGLPAHRGQPRPHAPTPPTSCWSTSPARSAPSPTRCRCRSATACSPRRPTSVVSVPEMFNYWLQPGRIDVGFLGAAQIDRRGQHQHDRDRATYDDPKVRLPGAGGAPEIAASLRRGDRRRARTARARSSSGSTSSPPSGSATAAGDRQRHGLRGKGPQRVITDLGVLRPDESGELMLTAAAPGRDGRAGARGHRLGPAGRTATSRTTPAPTDAGADGAAAPRDDEGPAMSDVYVVDAVRTPIGRYGGALAGVRPDDLAAHVVRALVARHTAAGSTPPASTTCCFGDANGAGEDNRNVARMAVLLAGLPTSVPGATVNRLCGSGLEAVDPGAAGRSRPATPTWCSPAASSR